MVPVAGSAYTYAYATLGELFAWIIGWDLVLEYAVGSATVAHGWSATSRASSTSSAGKLPHAIAGPRRSTTTRSSASSSPPASLINLPALLIVALRHGRAGHRDPGERQLQRRRWWSIKLAVGRLRDRRRRLLRQPAPTGTRSPPSARPGSASSATRSSARATPAAEPLGDARRRRDDLLRLHRLRLGLHPLRGGARTRSATCPIGIIVSLCSARCSTSRVVAVLTGMVPYDQLDIDAPVADAFRQRGPALGAVPDRRRRASPASPRCCW